MMWLILALFGAQAENVTAALARAETVPAIAARPDAHSAKPTYVCPMHSDVVSKSPGHCPICNMRLSPKLEVTEVRHGREITWVLA